MAHATKITIATGTTAYAGDPDSDEGISSREVRVEVTYELEPGEDPTLAVLLNTPEVERTRRIAWQCIRDAPEPKFDPAAPSLEPPDAPDADTLCDDPRAEVTTPHSGAAPVSNGTIYRTRPDEQPVKNGASTVPSQPEPEELATKPQQIAVRSHFTRLRLSKSDQRALLNESFGKFREDWLTKSEAALLMRALERGDWQKPSEPAAAVPFASVH